MNQRLDIFLDDTPLTKPRSRFLFWLLAVFLPISSSVFPVLADDVFDATAGILKVPAVAVGTSINNNTVYTDLTLTLGQVIRVSSGPPNGTIDIFDGGYLYIPSVSVFGNVYTNVVATISKVLTIGGATPYVNPLTMPMVVTPFQPPSAQSGAPYSLALGATGSGPFQWSASTVAPGSTNNHLTLSTNSGILGGTPYYTGNQPLLITATRQDGAAQNIQTELVISGIGSTQNITNTPSAGQQNQSYLWQAETTWGYTGSNLGCTPDLSFIFGSIPPGLTYNPLYVGYQNNDTFTGVPTFAGAYTFTLFGSPGSNLCAPDSTNLSTVTITINSSSTASVPKGSSGWTRATSSPVLSVSPAGWDSFTLGSPSVLNFGAAYYLYYEGLNSTTATHAIGVAISSDGIHWTKQANPVLSPGGPGAWDMGEVRYPTITNNGQSLVMIYQGWGGNGAALGMASSTDGLHWIKQQGYVSVLKGVVGDAYVPASLLYINGQYLLYYSSDGSIGLMTSTDAIHWSDKGFVFNGNGAVQISRASVVYDGSTYRMWYTRTVDANDGTAANSGIYAVMIGYADSADGITWKTYGNPIFTAGASGTWDRPGVGDPTVYYDGINFHMWYVGGRENLSIQSYLYDAFVEGNIGYATTH